MVLLLVIEETGSTDDDSSEYIVIVFVIAGYWCYLDVNVVLMVPPLPVPAPILGNNYNTTRFQ